jgi:hypothetical protein
MGIMVSEVYEALIEAGASEPRAKAAAEAIPAAEQLTTKADLAKLDGSLSLLATKESVPKLETRVARLEWATYAVVALLVKIAFFN